MQGLSYSSSSSTLSSLFKNQSNVITSRIRKLWKSPHPLIHVARDLCYQGHESSSKEQLISVTSLWSGGGICKTSSSATTIPETLSPSSLSIHLRSIIVLLVCKALMCASSRLEGASQTFVSPSVAASSKKNQCSHSPNAPEDQSFHLKSIESKQKVLAEITEMIFAAYTLHQTIVEIPKISNIRIRSKQLDFTKAKIWRDSPLISLLNDGNNLTTLMGDLLAKSSRGLASLRNARVTELMSNCTANLSDSQFINLGMSEFPEASVRNLTDMWVKKNKLGIGGLLGTSVHCALLFAGCDPSARHLGFALGETLGLLLQGYTEIGLFKNKEPENWIMPSQFQLFSLPLLVALDKALISKEKILDCNVALIYDYVKIHDEISQCWKALEGSKELLEGHKQLAERLLRQLATPTPTKSVRLLFDLICWLSQQ